MSTRRAFLAASAALSARLALGRTLIQEHVLVDFIGADRASKSRYGADEVFRVALPHLKKARELGCRTLVECTPAYLGRDPAMLRRLSAVSSPSLQNSFRRSARPASPRPRSGRCWWRIPGELSPHSAGLRQQPEPLAERRCIGNHHHEQWRGAQATRLRRPLESRWSLKPTIRHKV